MNKTASLISPRIEDPDSTTKKETIPPYLPGDCELTKETLEDGSIVFRNPHSIRSEVETYNIDLHSMIHCWLSKFQDLVKLLDDDSYGTFGYIFETIIQSTMYELDELNVFIVNSIGCIKIERVNSRDSLRRGDRIVMVKVE